MYNNLLFALKRRVMDEIIAGFDRHPAFSRKIKVYNKFPYEERVQFGTVLRNVSASQIRMSPDNYMADLISHVRLVRIDQNQGLAIEWVRENANRVTAVTEEDVSDQTGPTFPQRRFYTKYPILKGFGDTRYADNINDVTVRINGEKVIPEFVDGKKRFVMLKTCPASGDIVRISYYYRTIAEPGIYVIDFIEENKFLVAPVFFAENECIIEKVTGLESTASLAHTNIFPGTDDLYLLSTRDGNPVYLSRNSDYEINYDTGGIKFLKPLIANFSLFADYHWQPTDYNNGPYDFRPYQEIHNAIPGVILSIGRRSKVGDRQGVIVSCFREPQARIYGGHWNMSLTLAVISKDPIQMEEMTDYIVGFLWGERKNLLENEGITLNSVAPTGEAEETFIDTTGDMYYESSVDIDVMTEWQYFVPYLFKIKQIIVNADYMAQLGAKNYAVFGGDRIIFGKISPDTRRVSRIGLNSYERVS